MPLGATRGTLVAAQGNRIFTFATNPPAYSSSFTWALRNVNKYDATTDKWTSCARAPHPLCYEISRPTHSGARECVWI